MYSVRAQCAVEWCLMLYAFVCCTEMCFINMLHVHLCYLVPLFRSGAGMFVGSVVIGSVAITKPFRLTERPFLRDILFYLIAVFWTFVVLWQNKVTIYTASGGYSCIGLLCVCTSVKCVCVKVHMCVCLYYVHFASTHILISYMYQCIVRILFVLQKQCPFVYCSIIRFF